MKVYLCFLRRGKKECPEEDIVFATTSRRRYDQWFDLFSEDACDFRPYGHELGYRTRLMSPGQVSDFIYRGGPGV